MLVELRREHVQKMSKIEKGMFIPLKVTLVTKCLKAFKNKQTKVNLDFLAIIFYLLKLL